MDPYSDSFNAISNALRSTFLVGNRTDKPLVFSYVQTILRYA